MKTTLAVGALTALAPETRLEIFSQVTVILPVIGSATIGGAK